MKRSRSKKLITSKGIKTSKGKASKKLTVKELLCLPKEDTITSPEYKMGDRMHTRHFSQKQSKGKEGEDENTEIIEEAEEEEEIHTGVLPCPEEIDVETFEKEETPAQIGNLVAVNNQNFVFQGH